jgi:hypothetical protein
MRPRPCADVPRCRVVMLEEYFSLQLRFAERYATAAGLPFSVSIAHCTNLRRRLNLWEPAGASRWNDLLARVGDSVDCRSEALSLCMEWYENRPRLATERSFGCFSFDPPDTSGALRIHFVPPENTSTSPLASANVGARVQELCALFSYVRRTERNVLSVRGVSWLYNRDAYRRLFPRSYAMSIQPIDVPLHLNGSSTWGQVLNWRQEVKPDMRDALLARLATMRAEAPWEAFPLQALTATSDVAEFYERFT